MTEDEARQILQSFRPGRDDREDPQVAAAVREVERNPQLAKWLQDEQAFDRVVAGKLADVPEPFGLKTRILASQPRPQKLSGNLAAILAVIAAVLFLSAQLVSLVRTTKSNNSVSVADFAAEMVSFVRVPPPLELASGNLGAINNWLENKQVSAVKVPQNMTILQPLGCRVLSFRGHEVSLICFQRERGQIAHLFSVERTALPQVRAGRPPVFSRSGEWATASWAEGNRVYLVAVQGDENMVKRYLPHA